MAANADQAGGNPQAIAGLLKAMMEPPATQARAEAASRARRLQDGSVLWIEPSGAVTDPLGGGQGGRAVARRRRRRRPARDLPLGPADPRGAASAVAIFADLPEAEASVLLAGRDGLEAVVTSNPAVLHRPRGATSAARSRRPRSTRARRRAGAASGSPEPGSTACEFRGGETEEPDETWSDWRPSEAFHGLEGGCGARARFLQLRVALAGADAALRSVSVVAAAPNRCPAGDVTRGEAPGRQGRRRRSPTPPRCARSSGRPRIPTATPCAWICTRSETGHRTGSRSWKERCSTSPRTPGTRRACPTARTASVSS